MNRFLRLFTCVVLIGFVGTGAFGLGLCICTDGHVALEMGCHGGCRDAEDAPDYREHAEVDMFTAACGTTGGNCVYVPLSSGPMLYSSSEARYSLSARHRLPHTQQAGCLNGGVDCDIRPTALGALRRAPLHTSTSVLAQRTVVLRI